MNEQIFVTGATGNVGRALIEALKQRSKFRIIAGISPQNPLIQRNTPTQNKDTEAPVVPTQRPSTQHTLVYRAFDFTDSTTWQPALEGCRRIFLMRPPHISNIKRDMLPFLRFLAEQKPTLVVFLSVQGAEDNPIIPHYSIEKYCDNLGLPWVFLRPSFFMQNLTTTHLVEIRDENQLFIPAGKTGRTNFIDTGDIGQAAAALLTSPSPPYRAYTLTGTESYNYQEIAERLTTHLGKPISYKNPGFISFVFYHLRRGQKLAKTLVMYALYSAVRWGKADITTKDCSTILQRSPTSLDSFLAENRERFLLQ